LVIRACANVEALDQKRRRHVIRHRDQCGRRDREPASARKGKAGPLDQRQGLEAVGPCSLNSTLPSTFSVFGDPRLNEINGLRWFLC
jgi:hypothetical protein